jgi:hypothetical protein
VSNPGRSCTGTSHRLIPVVAILGAGVRAFDPSPSAGLACGRARCINPEVIEGSVAVRSGGIESPAAKEPEVAIGIGPGTGAPTRARESSGCGNRCAGLSGVASSQTAGARCGGGADGAGHALRRIVECNNRSPTISRDRNSGQDFNGRRFRPPERGQMAPVGGMRA